MPGGSGGDLSCAYDSDPNGPTAQVEVFVGPGAKQLFTIDKDNLGHDFTSFPGVGDQADVEPGAVFVRKGVTWTAVTVVALGTPDDAIQAALKALAPAMADRL